MSQATHQTVRLSQGKHRDPDHGACVVELSSMLADEPFSAYVANVLADAKRGEREGVMSVFSEIIDREVFGQAIRRSRGDQSKAARWLGVSRPTMRDKLQRYGLIDEK